MQPPDGPRGLASGQGGAGLGGEDFLFHFGCAELPCSCRRPDEKGCDSFWEAQPSLRPPQPTGQWVPLTLTQLSQATCPQRHQPLATCPRLPHGFLSAACRLPVRALDPWAWAPAGGWVPWGGVEMG